MNLTKNDRRRLTKKIEKQGDCLIWTGHISRLGYGYLQYKKKTYLAHRFMYQVFKGNIPNGLVLDHLCINRDCVKIEHLEPVTQKENVRRSSVTKRTEEYCANGHEWSIDNVYISSKGYRSCRVCDKELHYRKRHPEMAVL